MKRCNFIGSLFVPTLLCVTFSVNATLVSRLGGQAVYDTDLDITWISDVNLASTNTFGIPEGTGGIFNPGGNMSWDTANNWIDAINAANYLGFNDWRMPLTASLDSTCNDNPGGGGSADAQGFDCTGGEMGHLFYDELGGTGATSILNSSDPDVALFSNITISGGQHWSGTEFSSSSAWVFGIEGTGGSGQQVHALKGNNFSVLPVRDGDVGAVPIPAAIWLFGFGLMCMVGVVKRKKV